jgi:hypothetical protein
MKANRGFERSIPLLFLIVTVAAYGLLLPLTGFYWDDWPFAWIAKFLGPQEFIPAFAQVRPFLGPIFFVTTSLVPPVPLYWQIFALIIRFISALSVWFALNHVWPGHKRQILIASLLFLVFPGYSQHWVAFTHINQEWIPFIFYLLSFGFTARALRSQSALSPSASLRINSATAGQVDGSSLSGVPSVSRGAQSKRQPPYRDRRSEIEAQATTGNRPRNNLSSAQATRNTIYALLFLILGVFPTEYFVSIEPIRFLFIWVIVSETTNGFSQRFVQSLKYWLPYLLIWLANAAWLGYFYTIGGYESYEVEVINEPLTLIRIISTIAETIWKAGFYIWAQVLVLLF